MQTNKGQEKTSGFERRALVLLAGAVALLSVAFIVVTACGTWVLQQQSCGGATASTAAEEKTVSRNFDLRYNNVTAYEHVTVYPESRVEFVVHRNADTGHVETIATIDYVKKKSTIYEAKSNSCFIVKDRHLGDFDDILKNVEQIPEKFNVKNEVKLNVVLGERVMNASDIAPQMAAFCTALNTRYLEQIDNEQPGRVRRQSSGRYCYVGTVAVLEGAIIHENGDVELIYGIYDVYEYDPSGNCGANGEGPSPQETDSIA